MSNEPKNKQIRTWILYPFVFTVFYYYILIIFYQNIVSNGSDIFKMTANWSFTTRVKKH